MSVHVWFDVLQVTLVYAPVKLEVLADVKTGTPF